MEAFLAKLDERRRSLGLGHNAFARLLGCPPSTWSRTRTGRTRFSPALVTAALRAFPELAWYLPSGQADGGR